MADSIFVVDFFMKIFEKKNSGYLFYPDSRTNSLSCLVRRRSTVSCDPNTTRKETVKDITFQVIFEFNLIYGLVVNFADRKQNIFPSTHKIIVILLILQTINKTATVT